MKLFWGLVETEHPHHHTFDKDKWELVSEFESIRINRFTGNERSVGYVLFYTNTCLTCGDLVENRFDQIKTNNG